MPSESRISIVRNSPAGKAFLAEQSAVMVRGITTDVRELITSYAREAVETVAGLMRHAENEGVKLNASKDLLDRGGFKPTEKSEVVHIEVSSDDVERLMTAMKEAGEELEELEFIEDSSGVFKRNSEEMILDG